MAKRKKHEWQMNFRQMPESVLSKLESLPQNEFIIACVKKIPASDIAAGKYAHIGIGFDSNKLVFPDKQIPHPLNGRYCRINIQGKEIVLNHLPKVPKIISFEAPNFGDWSKGSHTVEQTRQVYPRENFPPKELELDIELLREEETPQGKIFIFKFNIVEVLDKKPARFMKVNNLKNDLFFNLNLLQENVGAADIYDSNSSREDYLKTVFINWEILPIGEREETISRMLSGIKKPTEETKKTLNERYDLLNKMKPLNFIRGVSGLRRYFGAKFADGFVVFENLEYGNAIYAMFDDWERLSKMSRLELLKGDRKGFERILHKRGWEEKLQKLVVSKRVKPAA